jgi:hypothetical protein
MWIIRHESFGNARDCTAGLATSQEPETDRQLLNSSSTPNTSDPSVSGPAAKTCQDGPADCQARNALTSLGVRMTGGFEPLAEVHDVELEGLCVTVLLHLSGGGVRPGWTC